MGTRSSITVHNPATGKHKSVYCHWDGYLDHNGRILLAHYNNLCDAYALVSGGGISSLDENILCPEGHTFENKVKGSTVFYSRDRGDAGWLDEPVVFKSLDACMKRTSQGYEYLYRDGKWWVHLSEYNEDGSYKDTAWLWMELSHIMAKLDASSDDACDDDLFVGVKKFR